MASCIFLLYIRQSQVFHHLHHHHHTHILIITSDGVITRNVTVLSPTLDSCVLCLTISFLFFVGYRVPPTITDHVTFHIPLCMLEYGLVFMIVKQSCTILCYLCSLLLYALKYVL